MKIRVTVTLFLVLLAFSARLALFFPDSNFSPDSADYLNIARNVASGRGFVHTIKWHFFTDDPVWHSAVGERPPLFPLLISCVWRLGGRLAAIDFLNVLFGVLAVALLFRLYERVLGSIWLAAGGAALVALNPSISKSCVFPWTEPLFLSLQTAVLLLVTRGAPAGEASNETKAGEKAPPASESKERASILPSARGRLLVWAGFLTALAYLARPSALALIAAVAAVFALRRRWRSLGLFLGPCALILGVWLAVVWAEKGSPFYSVQGHHFRVAYITEGMRDGWGKTLPSASQFIRENPVGNLIVANAWNYLSEAPGGLFRPPSRLDIGAGSTWTCWWLGIVGIGLLGVWRIARRPGVGLLTLLSFLHFILIAMVWATHVGDRFLQPVFVCLLPLCLGGLYDGVKWLTDILSKHSMRWPAAVVVALGIGATAFFYVQSLGLERFLMREHGAMQKPTPEQAENWKKIPENATIATDNPFVLNWLLDRPVVILPYRLEAANAADFFGRYGVDLVVVMYPRGARARRQTEELIRARVLSPLQENAEIGAAWFLVNKDRKTPTPTTGSS